jgi:CO/xanthine dehydrogenase FAD-binding subunit
MTTNAQLERQPEDLPPIVSAALPQIGHFQIRNRGTVGGALAHNDPAGEWPALALLLEARVDCRSKRGTRRLSPQEFMRGPLTTALQPDELLIAVELPRWPAGARWAFAEVARRPGDFALAGAAATVIGGRARAVVFACGPLPQVVGADGTFEVTGDVHASAAYRREVGKRLLEKVLEECR